MPRPAGRDRRGGDYLLGPLLGEGEGWQDFIAKHASLGVTRRVRVYPYARAASPDERERLAIVLGTRTVDTDDGQLPIVDEV